MKIIVLQGTPCAGKTTWAKEYVSGKKDWIVISLDELRHSCGDYWDLRREKVITKTEDALIRNAIEANMNMVIDSTNLNPDRIKYLQRIADEMEAEIEFKEMYVPFREAVRRDLNPDRAHHVGETVIRDFYQKYFPDRLAEELSRPEQETPAAPAENVTVTVTDPDDGSSVVYLSQQQLADLKKLAVLRYTISDIALMLDVPVKALRLRLADQQSAEFKAYTGGCLESEIAVRDRVRIDAERGEEWAIKQVEKWKTEQLADQLGCHI